MAKEKPVIEALKYIHAVARKFLARRGKGITSIPDRMEAESKAGEMAATFQQSGLPLEKMDEFIKSEDDVIKYLNIIEESKKPRVKQSLQPKPLMQSKPADVIDFPQDRITDWTKARPQPPEIEIIDGVQTTRGMGDLFAKQMKNIGKDKSNVAGMRPADDTLNKLVEEHSANMGKLKQIDIGDRPGKIILNYSEYTKLIDRNAQIEGIIKNARKVEDASAFPSYNTRQNLSETDPQIIARIKKQNKEAAERLRNKKDPDEPEGFYQGGQAEIKPDLSNIGHGSDALMARNMLIAPGSQATTSTGLNYLLGEDNDTTRVPYKEKGSVTLADLIKVNASGNKSGKNQIMGAPDGITANTETFNAIIKMDIPIMEKINLLGSYGYGKDRFKVEKDNKELFLGEDGYKDRNIGLGFNQNGEGLSGSVIRNLETGDNDYQLKFLKSFAEGGRAGYNEGNMVLPKPKPQIAKNKELLKQVMSQAGINTLDPRTREMFIEELKKKIRDENSQADGGRIEYGKGKLVAKNLDKGRRGFLKAAGAGAAGIAALKTGLMGFVKEAAPVAEKVVDAVQGVPPYFFKLVAKIKALGDDVTQNRAGTLDRENVKIYKDYELTEDVATGKIEIMKRSPLDGDESGHMLNEEVYMRYSPGEDIISKSGKPIKTEAEFVDDTSLMYTRGGDNGGIHSTEYGVPQSVLDEVEAGSGNVPESFYTGTNPIKKADGGRIGYAKGDIVTKGIPALLDLIRSKFGKKAITTADKLEVPQKTRDRDLFKNFELNNPEMKTLRDGKTKSIIPKDEYAELQNDFNKEMSSTPGRAGEGKFTKAEYLIQRISNTIEQNPKDKYVQDTFPNFIKELRAKPELAKNENVFKQLGGDLPEGQQIVVYGDDTLDFFTTKTGPGNIDRLTKLMGQYPDLSKERALKIMKMEPNDQVMELKMLEHASRTKHSDGGRIGFGLGGPSTGKLGILKALINTLAKERGMTGSEMLAVMNPKNIYKELKEMIANHSSKTFRETTVPEDLIKKGDVEGFKKSRLEALENYRDMMVSQQSFIKNIDAGKETPAREMFEMMEKTSPSPVPRNVGDEDITAVEQVIKNMSTEKRKLNSSGGIARMLGE